MNKQQRWYYFQGVLLEAIGYGLYDLRRDDEKQGYVVRILRLLADDAIYVTVTDRDIVTKSAKELIRILRTERDEQE